MASGRDVETVLEYDLKLLPRPQQQSGTSALPEREERNTTKGKDNKPKSNWEKGELVWYYQPNGQGWLKGTVVHFDNTPTSGEDATPDITIRFSDGREVNTEPHRVIKANLQSGEEQQGAPDGRTKHVTWWDQKGKTGVRATQTASQMESNVALVAVAEGYKTDGKDTNADEGRVTGTHERGHPQPRGGAPSNSAPTHPYAEYHSAYLTNVRFAEKSLKHCVIPDTGAAESLCSAALFSALPQETVRAVRAAQPAKVELRSVHGTPIVKMAKAKLKFEIEGSEFTHVFSIIDVSRSQELLLLGTDFLAKYEAQFRLVPPDSHRKSTLTLTRPGNVSPPVVASLDIGRLRQGPTSLIAAAFHTQRPFMPSDLSYTAAFHTQRPFTHRALSHIAAFHT